MVGGTNATMAAMPDVQAARMHRERPGEPGLLFWDRMKSPEDDKGPE
jgi:hypothetical protein